MHLGNESDRQERDNACGPRHEDTERGESQETLEHVDEAAVSPRVTSRAECVSHLPSPLLRAASLLALWRYLRVWRFTRNDERGVTRSTRTRR